MKKLLITSLAAMSLLAFGACGDDEEDKKECTSNAQCTDASKPVCNADGKCVADPGHGTDTECTSNDQCTDPSKPVCNASGVCVAGSQTDLCAGVTCNANETCNPSTGKCEANSEPARCTSNDDCGALEICNTETGVCEFNDPCADVTCSEGEFCANGECFAEGDTCDDNTFAESCDQNTVVYCFEGAVHTLDCGQGEGYSCDMIKEGYIADCFSKTEDACASGDEEKLVCAYYGLFTAFSAGASCQETVSGEYYYYYKDPTGETWEECEEDCDGATGMCAMPKEVPAGWTCNPDYYGDEDCDCGCGILDEDCADNSYASCEYATGCTATGYVNPEDSTQCVKVSGVGESCTPGENTASCNGEGIAINCAQVDITATGDAVYAVVASQPCDSAAPCETNGNKSAAACTPEGWSENCVGFWGDGYCDCGCGIVDVDCADDSYASCEYSGCTEGHVVAADPTTCAKVATEGDACDSSEYTEQCTDAGVMLSCRASSSESTAGKITGFDCGGDACLVDSNGEAACYSSDNACKAGDVTKHICVEESFMGFVLTSSDEMVCTQIHGDSYYYIATGKYELCDTTCNATTGLCD